MSRDLNNSNKRSSLNPFSWMDKDGKGIERDEKKVMEEPGFANFFKLLWRKLSNIISVNLLMIFGNFPIFFALAVLTGYFSFSSTAPMYTSFAPLYGAVLQDPGAFSASILGELSIQSTVTVLSTVDYVLLGLAALAIFTFGPVMVGSTYIMRNLFRQEPIFLMQDFFHSIRRNLKQALIFGVMDVAIIFILLYDIILYNLNFSAGMFNAIMFFAMICIALLYFFMRMYIYLMMVTFDLSILKLFKNAIFFSVLGVKRNICALLGVAAATIFTVMLVFVYMPIGIILPFVILFAFILYTTTYCAYPVIHKYMIAPYYHNDGTPITETDADTNVESAE